MRYVIVGLGNPGEEYEHTRHNVGRRVVVCLHEECDASDWRMDKTLRATVAKGVTQRGTDVVLVLPDNYMNRSGGAVAPLVKSVRQMERLVVVHDDIDLPLGTVKIVFNRGAGGHNGVRSIERALKTKSFVRVRVGVVPVTPGGTLRKPRGADKVHTFILKKLTPREREALDAVVRRAVEASLAVVDEGRDAAMQAFNRM